MRESRARAAAQEEIPEQSTEQQDGNKAEGDRTQSQGKAGATGNFVSREGTPGEKVTAGDKGSWLGKSWGGLFVLGPSEMYVQN